MPKITKSNTKQSKSITSNLSLHDHEQPHPLHAFKLNQQLKYQNNSDLYQDYMINKSKPTKTRIKTKNQQDRFRVYSL